MTAEKKRTLADVTRDFLSLQYVADENDGVLDGDLLDQFISIEEEFANKVDAALSVSQALKATAGAMRERVQRIQEHARSLESRAKSLEGWVLQNMDVTDTQQMKTANFALVKLAKKAPSVDLDEVLFLPWAIAGEHEAYLRRPAPEPAKKEILAALKRGEKIHGATLLTGGKRLAYK